MINLRKSVLAAMMTVFLVILVVSGILTEGLANTPEKLEYLTGWEVQIPGEKTGDSYYPPDRQSYVLFMHHSFSEDMHGRTISFRTNDSFLDAYLTNEKGERSLIYHFGEKLRVGDSPGTYTHFISLPDSGTGEIEIRIETVYRNKFLTEYDVAIGAKNELIFGYLKKEVLSVTLNIILLTFGLLLIVIYIVSAFKRTPIPEVLSLGALTVAFTVYANCPLYANQFIFQNAVVQYYLNYFSLYLLPLFTILYFEDIVPGMKMKPLFYAFVMLAAVMLLLHFTGISSFTRTIKVFIGALGVFALTAAVMISRKFSGMSALNKISLLTLLVFIILNVVFFIFVSTLGNQSVLTKIGLIFHIAIAVVDSIQKLVTGYFRERENELLHKIAYTDNLTELGNRYALERDTGKFPLDSISIVSLDLNYLKYTNDTFGHAGGDVLLKCAAECIASVYDKVYRVGGDEFIALVPETDRALLEALQQKLQDKISKYNTERTGFGDFADRDDFVLSIAAGYSSYHNEDSSYEQIMNRADEKMYQSKKEMHRTGRPKGKVCSA
ncbi:GGDEF domain-containing protein [Ruminococcus sp. HUN007]|uniref:GGDEF domain-containing protein n=1 Tax=Ruminococcus sp. HUN007 TaxID=1514668 RepID=UPI0005D15C55|nr:GGDEF domain-containing protein [Ruminococcus sp. HUN007]